jgi:hypothetical protein
MIMPKPANPVLVLVIALPLLAVAGSFVSLALALTRGDSELPKNYHWEGGALDHDDALQLRASRLHIAGTLGFDSATGQCTLVLRGAAPATLLLTLTHPTVAGLDRHLLLHPSGDHYAAPCSALPAAHWWLELSDGQHGWLLRDRLRGDLHEPVPLGVAATGAH